MSSSANKPGVGRYPGILKKPIRTGASNALLDFVPGDPEQTERNLKTRRKNVEEQELERLMALFDHFNIEPGDWFALALKLARTHVPGFRRLPNKKQGRTTQWTEAEQLDLWIDVKTLLHEGGAGSISDACRQLERSKKWRAKDYLRNRLRNHFYEAKRTHFFQAFDAIEAQCGTMGAIESARQSLEMVREQEERLEEIKRMFDER